MQEVVGNRGGSGRAVVGGIIRLTSRSRHARYAIRMACTPTFSPTRVESRIDPDSGVSGAAGHVNEASLTLNRRRSRPRIVVLKKDCRSRPGLFPQTLTPLAVATTDPSPEEEPPMRYCTASLLVALSLVSVAPAYVEAPYSLGQVCHESTTIVLVEVTKVNKEKNLIVY